MTHNSRLALPRSIRRRRTGPSRGLATCQGKGLATCQGRGLATCQGRGLATCQDKGLATCQGRGLATCISIELYVFGPNTGSLRKKTLVYYKHKKHGDKISL